VFGLNGRWGEGKTSVLNLVKRKLQSPNIIIVEFNPWYFTNELGMLEGFYGSIERAIESRFLLPSFKRRFRQYLKTLSVGLEHKPFSFDLKLPENPDRIRQELEEFIAQTGVRLVVILDDIDRLDHDLALGALALTRLSARFQNTIFLLALDTDDLSRKKIDQKFLEKIIQKQIALPPAENRDLDGFFLYSEEERSSATDSLLDSLAVSDARKSRFHEEIDPFYPKHLRSVFMTLRDVKRFLNVLRPSIAPVIAEVNLFDFFLLTILQVFVPQIVSFCRPSIPLTATNGKARPGLRTRSGPVDMVCPRQTKPNRARRCSVFANHSLCDQRRCRQVHPASHEAVGGRGFDDLARVEMRNFFVRVEDPEVLRAQSHQDDAVGHRAVFPREVVVAAATALVPDDSRLDDSDAMSEDFLARRSIDESAVCEQPPRRGHGRIVNRIAVPIFVAYASAQH